MRRVLFTCLVFLLFVSTAQAGQSITYELDNRAGSWNHRLMLLANPVSDLMVDLRKGVGGQHLQALMGWNFSLGEHFTIAPYLGIGLNDSSQLEPIYAQGEVITALKFGIFSNVFIIGYSHGLDDDHPSTIYLQDKAGVSLGKFWVGLLTDMLLLPQSEGDIAFWRLGPRFGYKLSDLVQFTLWPNYEVESETAGFRAGVVFSF